MTTLLLIVDTTYSVRREIELFDHDMQHDAKLLGDALRRLIMNVWENSSELEAIQVIDNLNETQSNIKVRWIWFDDLKNDPFISPASRQFLMSILSRQETTFLNIKHQDGHYLHTFVPVQIEHVKLGAIELSETMTQRDRYVKTTILHAVILIVGLLMLNGILLWLLGRKIVGRPLQRLVEKTRRISDGDLTADIVLGGNDELNKLAASFNQMCERLNEAREKVRLETEKRIATLEQLRHSERLATVGRLASGIAHELGTPLNVVAGRAKLIVTESLTEQESKEFAAIIHEQAERMTKIIRQLLDFSRRRTPQRSAVPLQMLLRQIKEMLDPIARKNKVEIVLGEISHLTPMALDREQIQQVLINLVMNAIQAMPAGGVVQIHAQIEDGGEGASKEKQLTITVSDNGEGISPEHKEHIFEPFFTTKDIGIGTGLGLSIVHGIIEEHGGHIDVKSERGKGTTFIISLPVDSTT
ncbi:HAMP domain-containing protein [candidate division KSB1 bacterium]|nr:HAMP domain-containing protein [candidate division KSB1 bacterium]